MLAAVADDAAEVRRLLTGSGNDNGDASNDANDPSGNKPAPAVANECDEHGHTALHYAAGAGSSRAVVALLEGGADVLECEGGTPPLVHAAINGRTTVVRILAEHMTRLKDKGELVP